MSERTIYQIFADVKREVRPVGKDSKNQQQNFNYRGIDAVVNAAAGALDKHGVITVPMLEQYEYDGSVEVGKNRSLMGHVKVQVTYRFYGPAGDHFDARVPGEAMDSGDKATPKAMSVAYRIALLQCLNLPTSEADPDSQTYERSPRAVSAGDAFENAAPARPQRQQERPAARAQDIPPDETWHSQAAPRDAAPPDDPWQGGGVEWALEQAAAVRDGEAAGKLWKEAGTKAHAKDITPADEKKVKDLLNARAPVIRKSDEALRRLDGQWADKIRGIADEDEARRVLAEAAGIRDVAKGHLIREAVAVWWPDAAGEQGGERDAA